MSDSSEESQDNIDYDDDHIISEDEENEILPSEEDDDDHIVNDRFNRFKIKLKKDEMASDIEDEDEDDQLPSVQAWGKDKRSYYYTDYVDKDFRSQKQKDENLAEYEEEEALQIQKRLLDAISEEDLGIDLLIGDNVTRKHLRTEEPEPKSISMSSVLTDSQKLSLIKQESPELESLISDFEKYLAEVRDELEPLVLNLQSTKAISSSGLKFLKLRIMLLLNYCANITFYCSMKCSPKGKIVKDHPIIKRLFTYKKLITELDSCKNKSRIFQKEIEYVKQSIASGKKLKFNVPSIPSETDNLAKPLNEKKKSEKDTVIYTEDRISDSETLKEDEKRAITYEMEKNKGLMPKRKKEQRNPRVKYRKKFEKAVVRRKGQVREPRKELRKYGGELTGINVHAIKSVKFK